MANSLKSINKWTLLTIKDKEFLPGQSIANIIQLVSTPMSFKFAILDYINGAASNGLILSLQEKSNQVLKIENILPEISKVIQFDWGDFFLFQEYPKNWKNPKTEQYPFVIAQTDTTVRAVDDQYIYIYTPYDEIEKLIKKNFQIESATTDFLENLDYPE